MNSLKDQRVIGASNGVHAHETSRAARSGSKEWQRGVAATLQRLEVDPE